MDGQSPRALTHESSAHSIIIGRDSSADFQIPLSTISRQHARISLTDDLYIIEDLGSTHGTMLNGKRVEKGEKKIMHSGDLIELTRARITATIEEIEKPQEPEQDQGTQSIASKAVQGILSMLGDEQSERPYLRILSGPDEGARFVLAGTVTTWTIGRSKECEFVIDDPNVSRRHAEIKKDWSGYSIIDLGSKNGVVINEKLIQKPRRLKDKDEIIIGPVKLIFIDPDAGLLDALKDVPGFEINDSMMTDDDPPHIGAPTETEQSSEAEGEEVVNAESSEDNVSNEAKAEGEGENVDGSEATEGEVIQDFSEQSDSLEDAFASNPDLSSMIDPELLQSNKSKFPTEWLIIGFGAVLLITILVLLVFLVF